MWFHKDDKGREITDTRGKAKYVLPILACIAGITALVIGISFFAGSALLWANSPAGAAVALTIGAILLIAGAGFAIFFGITDYKRNKSEQDKEQREEGDKNMESMLDMFNKMQKNSHGVKESGDNTPKPNMDQASSEGGISNQPSSGVGNKQ